MCGQKLKRLSALSVLFCLLSFSPLSFSCFAEVKLTEEEAETILNEISESKKELENVKNTYNEQMTSYEMQLNEAKKQNQTLKAVAVATSSSSVALTIVVILLIIF